MAKVFFSYCHKDAELRQELETHLSLLKRRGKITAWHDREIVPGDDLHHSISQNLQSADLILFLVSPAFIASDYCFDVEVKAAMRMHETRQARVLPIILRPCDWHEAPFGHLLASPKDGKPIVSWPNMDEAMVDVVAAIKRALTAIEAAQPPAAPASSPSTPPAPKEPRREDPPGGASAADEETFVLELFALARERIAAALRRWEKGEGTGSRMEVSPPDHLLVRLWTGNRAMGLFTVGCYVGKRHVVVPDHKDARVPGFGDEGLLENILHWRPPQMEFEPSRIGGSTKPPGSDYEGGPRFEIVRGPSLSWKRRRPDRDPYPTLLLPNRIAISSMHGGLSAEDGPGAETLGPEEVARRLWVGLMGQLFMFEDVGKYFDEPG